MSSNVLLLIERLGRIFDVIDFSQEKKEKLFSELIDGVFTLAMAKTLKENPDLAKKLNAVGAENLTSDKLDSLGNVLDVNSQSTFSRELQVILDDYVLQVSATVDGNKKHKIQEIWKSEESPVPNNYS